LRCLPAPPKVLQAVLTGLAAPTPAPLLGGTALCGDLKPVVGAGSVSLELEAVSAAVDLNAVRLSVREQAIQLVAVG